MIVIDLDDFEREVLTVMLSQYYEARHERLAAVKQSRVKWQQMQIIICIEAKCIATYLLELYLAQCVEKNEKLGVDGPKKK